jgi:hypothetical protein
MIEFSKGNVPHVPGTWMDLGAKQVLLWCPKCNSPINLTLVEGMTSAPSGHVTLSVHLACTCGSCDFEATPGEAILRDL